MLVLSSLSPFHSALGAAHGMLLPTLGRRVPPQLTQSRNFLTDTTGGLSPR